MPEYDISYYRKKQGPVESWEICLRYHGKPKIHEFRVSIGSWPRTRSSSQVTLHYVDRKCISRVRDQHHYPLWHPRAAKLAQVVSIMTDIALDDKRKLNQTSSTRYSWQNTLISLLTHWWTSVRAEILRLYMVLELIVNGVACTHQNIPSAKLLHSNMPNSGTRVKRVLKANFGQKENRSPIDFARGGSVGARHLNRKVWGVCWRDYNCAQEYQKEREGNPRGIAISDAL